MAAIQGQPAPKPESLKEPVPGDAAEKEADDFLAQFSAPSVPESADTIEADQFLASLPQGEVQPAEQEFQSPFYTSALPTVGGLIGGIAGGLGGGLPGAVGGAALGAAGGQSWRDLIETNILGKKQKTSDETIKDIVETATVEGAGQLIGAGVAKGAGIVARSASNYISAPIKNYMSNAIKMAKESIEGPLTKLLFNKSTHLNTEQAGDAIKSLLKENIKTKYGTFVQAYSDLDAVTKSIPIDDVARKGFIRELKGWATESLGGDNLKLVNKFAGELDSVINGKQLDDVIGQINDAKDMAFRSGAGKQGAILQELADRASDFLEGRSTDLAMRISSGNANQAELQFLNTIVRQRGIQEPDPTKYIKNIAKDYLNSKEKLKSDYSGFKDFLRDVAEQTKVKINKKGPMTFINAVDNVPSEKLVEKMFDPKNAAALRKMQAETPEVFDMVTKSKLSQMIQKSSLSGDLDLKALRTEILKLPPSTRSMLFSADEFKMLNQVVMNPRLQRISMLQKAGDNMVSRWTQDLMTAVGIGVEQLGGKSAPATVLRQAIGEPISSRITPPFRDRGNGKR